MSNLIFLYHFLVLFALVALLVNFLLNQLAVTRLHARPPEPNGPLVSILIPARNEAAVIGRCLVSIQAQNYPRFEVIVLDDQSEDRTASIVRDLGFSDSADAARRILTGTPLPNGWVGKPWACHQLSRAARGDYLLFIDADTDHAPSAVSSAMAEALETKADLLTVWPAQETGTWSEKLVIPILFIAAGGLLPHWLMNLAQKNASVRRLLSAKQWRKLGAANGQFMLFSRAGYDRIGGHLSVKNEMVEDVSLGREVASRIGEGLILQHADGGEIVSTRMYQSFAQLWEGFTKNAWPIFEGNLNSFRIALVVQLLVFVGPFLFLPFANASWLILFFQIVLIYFIRLIFLLRFQTSWLGALLHPVGYLLATAIMIQSYRKNLTAGLTWKGRTYHVG